MAGRFSLKNWVGFVALIGIGLAIQAGAQEPQARTAAKKPPAGFRKLAPGVETTIPLPVDPHDTVTQHDIVELLTPGVVKNLDWKPTYSPPTKTLKAMATNRPFRRNAWYLQFTFKPLRIIDIDLPAANGRLEHKTVWYLVYRVKNIGGHLKPVESKEQAADPLAGAPAVEAVDDVGQPIYFFPKFSLEAEIDGAKKVYADTVLPLATESIQRREDPNRVLLNTVQITKQAIPLSTATQDNSVWGVATWVDIDPRIDYFSVYINGLTSAYRWTDPPGAFKAGDPPTTGREFKFKTLQLNFWRPGDEFQLLEDEIFIGSPSDKVKKYENPDGATAEEKEPAGGRNWEKIIDHRWIFR